MIVALVLTALLSVPSLVPELSLAEVGSEVTAAKAPGLALAPSMAFGVDRRSPWGALGLTALCEGSTLFFGPSCGHLYAGETLHFAVTGGFRVMDLLALYVLEKWAYGTPPLYAVVQPHLSRSLSAYPLAYPLDLLLVALWWGTGLYDLVDSFFAARRYDHREELKAMADEGVPLLRF